MDDVVSRPQSHLYDTDFYAWTQEQAALLRSGRLAQADIANILEEIETLGRKEVSELRSRLTVLVQHLLKEQCQSEKASRSWAATIVVQRQRLARHISENPSLKPRISRIFSEALADAREVASAETGLPMQIFSDAPSFSFEQAMDETFWPGRDITDRN